MSELEAPVAVDPDGGAPPEVAAVSQAARAVAPAPVDDAPPADRECAAGQTAPPPAPPAEQEGSQTAAAAGVAAEPAGPALDPAVAVLCEPLSEADPCGPDLDSGGDGDFLNYFALAENLLPSSFFSPEDGRPFDAGSVDLKGQLDAMKPLLARTRDLRLLVLRSRLQILGRDLPGFAVTVSAIAECLERFWDLLHPRAEDGDIGIRAGVISSLELPTVIFPLQYTPLYDAGRIGAITYRTWMVASGEVKPRQGEQKHPTSALTDAMAVADHAALAATRRHVAVLKAALGRIRNAFALAGSSAGLEKLPALVDQMSAFVDPTATQATPEAGAGGVHSGALAAVPPAGAAPTSLAQAREALAAVAAYYSRMEPSSPTLPLVRQAHQLIGKSFIEVMTILVPTQMEKAAFQIGAEQVFELPLGRLSKLPETEQVKPADAGGQSKGAGQSEYRVESRPQAIALLDQVQRFFRASEPGSPVPMLCERARTLAERDFMAVLRDVLPKAALKNAGVDR